LNDAITELRKVCQELRLIDEDEMVDKALCAFAALTDSKSPRVDLTYTYVMRKLRKEGDKEKITIFQTIFKDSFDQAVDQDLDDPDQLALMRAIQSIDFEA
jgi:hypothetical protein